MVTLEKEEHRAKKELFRTLKAEIRNNKVLSAMEAVPRELFVSLEARHLAYEDIPLSIGEGQTISQPFIVALMTSLLELRGYERVLELGTGSGYQAAILSRLVSCGSVLTLERSPQLADAARDRLQCLGYLNVEVCSVGDVLGAPDRSPFDAIIVTAASPRLPVGLVNQMAVGGRMVIPIGSLNEQELVRVIRTGEGPTVQLFGRCRFVPLLGDEAWPPSTDSR